MPVKHLRVTRVVFFCVGCGTIIARLSIDDMKVLEKEVPGRKYRGLIVPIKAHLRRGQCCNIDAGLRIGIRARSFYWQLNSKV